MKKLLVVLGVVVVVLVAAGSTAWARQAWLMDDFRHGYSVGSDLPRNPANTVHDFHESG